MSAPAPLAVFILAKNEAANIGRALDALASTGWPVTVLDSGSTDETPAIVAEHGFARLQPFDYTDHHDAYNAVTTKLGAAHERVIILDADMVMSPALIDEVKALEPSVPVVSAPVTFCVQGQPLAGGSLYPPKPFLFATGTAWYVRSGHAERVKDGVNVQQLAGAIRHDDRKPFASFLAGQARYSESFVRRLARGEASGRDRLRARWPLLIFAVPLVSLLWKRGLLSGRPGLVYALDKLIAEAIMHRQALAARLDTPPD
jgi:(heptosyl)LPS beta-1,4-glucosyltransferase